MTNRRNFLKKTALATAGLALTSFKNTTETAENKEIESCKGLCKQLDIITLTLVDNLINTLKSLSRYDSRVVL